MEGPSAGSDCPSKRQEILVSSYLTLKHVYEENLFVNSHIMQTNKPKHHHKPTTQMTESYDKALSIYISKLASVEIDNKVFLGRDVLEHPTEAWPTLPSKITGSSLLVL